MLVYIYIFISIYLLYMQPRLAKKNPVPAFLKAAVDRSRPRDRLLPWSLARQGLGAQWPRPSSMNRELNAGRKPCFSLEFIGPYGLADRDWNCRENFINFLNKLQTNGLPELLGFTFFTQFFFIQVLLATNIELQPDLLFDRQGTAAGYRGHVRCFPWSTICYEYVCIYIILYNV
jgi:hypothetical protein